jgi:hypothetical protein
MKKLLTIFVLSLIMILPGKTQPVAEYQYKLDNGINVKTDHTWSQVWINQSFSPLNSGEQNPLAVNVRALGDLISGSNYKLMSNGKEVKLKGINPGTYDLKMVYKLSGEPGTLSFLVNNVVIKPKTKTTVSVTLYDYQVIVDEVPSQSATLSSYESEVHRCKVSTVQDNLVGIPTFYESGKRDKAINPDQGAGTSKGKIKIGTYDVLLTVGISGQNQKIWLENFQMKPGTSYKITTNLNAGGIIYTGGNREVVAMHLYPAGTSAKQTSAAPDKNLETISYTNINNLNCCSPGTFDVLLRSKNQKGEKYEWRKNIAVTTGMRTEVK